VNRRWRAANRMSRVASVLRTSSGVSAPTTPRLTRPSSTACWKSPGTRSVAHPSWHNSSDLCRDSSRRAFSGTDARARKSLPKRLLRLTCCCGSTSVRASELSSKLLYIDCFLPMGAQSAKNMRMSSTCAENVECWRKTLKHDLSKKLACPVCDCLVDICSLSHHLHESGVEFCTGLAVNTTNMKPPNEETNRPSAAQQPNLRMLVSLVLPKKAKDLVGTLGTHEAPVAAPSRTTSVWTIHPPDIFDKREAFDSKGQSL